MDELERLKSLVLEEGYDKESRDYVAQLEERFHKTLMAEKLMDNPAVSDYIKYLKAEQERCSYLLANDPTLTEEQRNKLFAKREIAEEFTQVFTGTQLIRAEIKDLLNVHKD